MRAKNEFRFLAEAYDTKLVLERIVDGKLMCPEACCGAPVIECTCGEDCPHCNCFMIHKAMKNKDFTDKLLKEGYDDSDAALWRKQMEMEPKKVSPEELERIKKQKPAPQGRLTMPGDKDRDDTHTLKEMQRDIMNGMTAKESMERMGIHPANQKSLLAKYLKWSEEWSEGPIETGFEGPIISQLDVEAAARERLRQKYGEDNEDLSKWDEEGNLIRGSKGEVLGPVRSSGFFDDPKRDVLQQAHRPPGWVAWKEEQKRKKEGGSIRREDNEEPRRGISGYEHKPDPMIKAHREEMARLKKIDLSKWRDHIENNPKTGVDDIMKKVHKQYPKASLPSKYSKDYDIVWDKKVRPFLMHEFPDN